MKNKSIFSSLLVLFLILLLPAAVHAQDGEHNAGQYFITNFDLGVSELELGIGESFTFDVQYEPEDTILREFRWFSTNSSVADIDIASNTVTATGAGTTVLFAESLDGSTFAECTLTVNGPESKDGSEAASFGLEALSDEDHRKIKSETFRNFYDFIFANEFDAESMNDAGQRIFSLIAKVIPGTEIAESEKAAGLAMTDISALQNIHAIVFQGSFEQVLAYMENNENLREIAGGGLTFLDPSLPELAADNGQKSVNLQSNVEKITEVSLAHDQGYKGKGITIGILDTGLDKNHEQFKGRVIKEKCFSTSGEDSSKKFFPFAKAAAQKPIQRCRMPMTSAISPTALMLPV